MILLLTHAFLNFANTTCLKLDLFSRFVDPASCSQSMKATAVDDLDKDEAEQTNSPTRYFGGVPSVSSEVDWMEPTAKQLSNPTPCGSDIVSNAFQLLQTEPSVQVRLFSSSISRL